MRILGFFCEDVRREMAKTESIVGILPNNMNIPETPGMIAKLAIYVRAQVDLDEEPQEIALKLRTPWGEIVDLGGAQKALVEQSQKNATDSGLPFAGIIMRALLAPFPIQSHGLIRVVAMVGGEEWTCAVLNLKPTTVTSSASAPPASQSPSGAPASS